MADLEMRGSRRRCGFIASGTELLFCSFLLTGCIRYHTRPFNPVQYQANFLNRRLQDPGLADFVRANGSPSTVWPPPGLTLEDTNLIAAYYNPDLAVARAQLESAKAAVITAGGRPNPVVSGGAGYETVPRYPVAIHFDLSLPIETAGKRHYRILAAQEQLGAANVGLREAEWNTYVKARDAWFEYAAAQQLAEAYHAEAAERARAASLLEQRLAVGEVSEPLVNQARIAASEAALASAAAESKKETAEADFANALGLTREAIPKTAPDASKFIPPPALESLPFFEVQQKGLLNRLDVRRVELEYAAAEAQLHLAIAQQYPDIQLNPTYDYQEGFHLYSFGPSLSIPVLNRNRGPIAEANAHRAATEARFEAIQDHAIGEMQHALAQYKAALLQYREANEHWLALQQNQERRMERSVQLGNEDQLALTETRVETSVAQRARADALQNAWHAYEALENSVQVPLTGVRIVNQSSAKATGVKP